MFTLSLVGWAGGSHGESYIQVMSWLDDFEYVDQKYMVKQLLDIMDLGQTIEFPLYEMQWSEQGFEVAKKMGFAKLHVEVARAWIVRNMDSVNSCLVHQDLVKKEKVQVSIFSRG